MNKLKNRVQLIGNLGKNPEVRQLTSGKVLASFSLATNEQYRDSEGNKVKETQWHQIIAWGKIASIVEQFLEKGKEVIVEGKLTYRNYEDKEGIKRYVTEIVADEIVLLGRAS